MSRLFGFLRLSKVPLMSVSVYSELLRQSGFKVTAENMRKIGRFREFDIYNVSLLNRSHYIIVKGGEIYGLTVGANWALEKEFWEKMGFTTKQVPSEMARSYLQILSTKPKEGEAKKFEDKIA